MILERGPQAVYSAESLRRKATSIIKNSAAKSSAASFATGLPGNPAVMVAAGGADAFYRGPIAKSLLKTSQRLGGVMSAEDLAEFEPEWVAPISTTYRGWKVFELPPNGQGLAALSMLNIMERYPLASFDARSADALHHKIEAQKLAYADLARWVGDPRFAKVPVDGLISKSYAEQRAKHRH